MTDQLGGCSMNQTFSPDAVVDPDPPREVTVLVVDDHRSFGDLLAGALRSVAGLTCVGTAVTAADGVGLAADLRPDVVMMDIQMPQQDGLWATREIVRSAPGTVVVMMTAHRDPQWVTRAAQAGASGFVPKDGSLAEILDVVRRARVGQMVVAPAMFASAPAEPSAPEAPRLTDRELQVLQLLGKGHNATAISRLLRISIHTCRGYIKTLHGKLGATSQLEAVVKAQHLGLLGAEQG